MDESGHTHFNKVFVKMLATPSEIVRGAAFRGEYITPFRMVMRRWVGMVIHCSREVRILYEVP